MVKFVDDITISTSVSKDSTDATINEVNSMKHLAASIRMTLNLSKTWEMLIHGKTTEPNEQPARGIERKSWLKLLGIIFQENLVEPSCRQTNSQGKQSPIHIEGLQVLWLFSRSIQQVI